MHPGPRRRETDQILGDATVCVGLKRRVDQRRRRVEPPARDPRRRLPAPLSFGAAARLPTQEIEQRRSQSLVTGLEHPDLLGVPRPEVQCPSVAALVEGDPSLAIEPHQIEQTLDHQQAVLAPRPRGFAASFRLHQVETGERVVVIDPLGETHPFLATVSLQLPHVGAERVTPRDPFLLEGAESALEQGAHAAFDPARVAHHPEPDLPSRLVETPEEKRVQLRLHAQLAHDGRDGSQDHLLPGPLRGVDRGEEAA